MNIQRRLERLEKEAPPPSPGKWEVVVSRPIMVPGDHGPEATGKVIFSRWIDGEKVDYCEH